MQQLNQVHLRGIVGLVKETKTGNDHSITLLNVATKFAYRSQDGSAVIDTTWHSVTGYDIEPIKKGDKVDIIGRLRNQKYTDKDGNEHYSTDIMAKEIHKIDEPLNY